MSDFKIILDLGYGSEERWVPGKRVRGTPLAITNYSGWAITHIATGMKAGPGIFDAEADAREAARKFWNSLTAKEREAVEKAKPGRLRKSLLKKVVLATEKAQ